MLENSEGQLMDGGVCIRCKRQLQLNNCKCVALEHSFFELNLPINMINSFEKLDTLFVALKPSSLYTTICLSQTHFAEIKYKTSSSKIYSAK